MACNAPRLKLCHSTSYGLDEEVNWISCCGDSRRL